MSDGGEQDKVAPLPAFSDAAGCHHDVYEGMKEG